MNHRLTLHCTLSLLLLCASLTAQNTMRVHYSDGTQQDISLSQVDSVTFATKDAPQQDASLTGTWLWGKTDAEYYELITFSEDHTYTGYDNYFTYGFDAMTYGWYSWYGNMLSLQSNGYGYQRMYSWIVTGLTVNALEVMTRMGPYTYYRLQQEVLHVSVSEPYAGLSDGDSIVFADGVVVKAEGDRLLGITPGTTYVLVRKASLDMILAYKVTVQ